MEISTILNSPWFYYGILPLLIFLSRVVDVSIGTVRLIFVSKGFKKLAPLLGFFEVLIWLLAIQQIMKNMDNWVCYLAYGAGFAAGNYVGMLIEQKLSFGKVIVRAVSKKDSSELLERLKHSRYSATLNGAASVDGDVHLITCVTEKKKVNSLLKIINEFNPGTFYSVSDVRSAKDGYLPKRKRKSAFSFLRKAK
jgi:uncharacterized protein YebE (UPF0316 family)